MAVLNQDERMNRALVEADGDVSPLWNAYQIGQRKPVLESGAMSLLFLGAHGFARGIPARVPKPWLQLS